MADPTDIDYWENEDDYYKYMENRKSPKDKIITYPLDVSTCWFNAIVLTMFYSKYSRDMVKDVMNEMMADNDDEVHSLFYTLLNNLYKTDEDKDHKFYKKNFEKINSRAILKKLNKNYGDLFSLDVCTRLKFESELYIKNMYSMFSIDCAIFTKLGEGSVVNSIYNKYKYSNKDGSLEPVRFVPYFSDHKDPPDVVVMMLGDENEQLYADNRMSYLKEHVPQELSKFVGKERVVLSNYNYILDSVIISNYNTEQAFTDNHTICCIRIKNKKYIYDGRLNKLSREYDDDGAVKDFKIPCNLVNHNWRVGDDQDLVLNNYGCGFSTGRADREHSLLFNLNKGKRLLVYIKQEPVTKSKATRSVIKK